MPTPRAEVLEVLRREDDFLLAAHVNPDGDAVGSLAALGFVLKALGKRFTLYCATGAPRHYDWLTLPSPLRTELPEDGFSWVVTLDCGDLGRVGEALEYRARRDRLVNIDHHLGNPGFGAVNWVDPTSSSTGEMIADLARDLGLPLSGPLGEAIYTAVVTDTGYFSFNGTSPRTLELAAELMRQGLSPGRVNAKIQNQWSLGRIRLWSEVLRGAALHMGGKVGSIRIPKALLDETETTAEDCDGIINFVLRVRGVRLALSVRENAPGRVKFSLRSVGDVNVQALAVRFGGGGHKNAAGGAMETDLETAEATLVAAAMDHLKDDPAHA